MRFVLNGAEVAPDADAGARLLDVLREGLGLTGTKWACEIGRCGACTVLVDGAPQAACLTMLWQVEGRSVTTIEGLDPEHPVPRAFAEAGAFQCGYCAPGMILATVALLDRTPNPSEAETEAALAGNLCRCSGYMGVRRAVGLLST